MFTDVNLVFIDIYTLPATTENNNLVCIRIFFHCSKVVENISQCKNDGAQWEQITILHKINWEILTVAFLWTTPHATRCADSTVNTRCVCEILVTETTKNLFSCLHGNKFFVDCLWDIRSYSMVAILQYAYFLTLSSCAHFGPPFPLCLMLVLQSDKTAVKNYNLTSANELYSIHVGLWHCTFLINMIEMHAVELLLLEKAIVYAIDHLKQNEYSMDCVHSTNHSLHQYCFTTLSSH